ncbi:probable F-box protein At2g36090 [Andrographis paniculata]|uniref:probable F-box protein At2g36090 n=1 Tax=Andrographis paniculata TaxID=175694 RepID=UPI0021E95AFD|nr:probable F-box protein At2g36090 [Andrographis paniculata]
MESEHDHFRSLDQDLVLDIMSRLDGCTLAAMASTCTCLSDAAREDRLWQKICGDTWPSTSNRLLRVQIASSNQGGFKSFYANAFPLILYKATREALENIPAGSANDTEPSPWDFMSLVDIYFKGSIICSKVVDGIMESTYGNCNDNVKRFLCYPFKLDLHSVHSPKDSSNYYQDFGSLEDYTKLPPDAFKGYEDREDACKELLQDLRLSWILFDKRQGKAVNISSWKARSIYRSNPSANGYVLCFGCIIPIDDDNILTQPVAECVITAKCNLMIKQGCIKWKEITLVIKQIDGSHLNGERSMVVMKQATNCTRSINHCLVELGYQQFYKLKNELKWRNEQEESSANILSAVTAIVTLLGICYACATLF